MDKLNAVEKFFYDHAGVSYNPATETLEQGKVRGAKLYASAEQWARETGYSFEWGIDPYSCSADWFDDNEDGGKNNDPWPAWKCVMYNEKGGVVQSLHGTDLGRGGTPYGDPYRRVVEAELALEEWRAVVKS